MVTRSDIEIGLDERYAEAGHDTVALLVDDDTTKVRCQVCRQTVTVTWLNEYGGYRVAPDITTLDTPCAG